MEISVVTAVFNGDEYLEEAIESILKQTFTDFEYIIVNDGSDDNTKEILDNITDQRVKVIHLEKNGGAANALNVGINEARGKWIALQDADDVSSEHRLQKQLQYIKSDSRLVVVGSLIQCIVGNDQVDQNSLKRTESFFNGKKNFRNDQFYSTPICNGSGLFLKSVFEKIGGYDPTFKIAYDYDLWTRMFEVGEISRVPEVLYQYRKRGNSLAHSDRSDTAKEVLLSAFKNISELRFKHLNRKPKMLLMGTKRKLEFYRENLEHENDYLMISFRGLGLKNAKRAYSLYQSNEIDGIMIAVKKSELFRFFGRRSLTLGKNLFKIRIP
ncbi:glycosyltransferase [Neobacillus sp. 179-C4.2 HS]|uniref:Glycosyltransferase n=1 Tax=Neobacillus driksii TaxID=3035913 RepID=A0ABV4YQ62_9BACI|nr:glycosyltransferase [Neobacillus sp. 179.-C4.2 HS]MDP5195479.1 glycosyltransferase [Neobacillus sp. 179.-C4.2 HS]